jgi:hypothetical protein
VQIKTASDNWPRTEERDDDRRSSRRYPLESDMAYKIVHRQRVIEVGSGRTVNMSASGILFESTRALPVGAKVELSVAWPARLGARVRLQVCIMGRTVWSSSKSTAVQIQRYDFRTAGGLAAIRAGSGLGASSH